LYIATNKRLIPTKKILDYLSWNSFFSAVYSIDSNTEKPFKNKGEMIRALLNNEMIDLKSAVYIGDRDDDYEAANKNGLPCILVEWGYGSKMPKNNGGQFFAKDPIELLNTIERVL
jgi:phosphoglycolate phosphatase